MHYTWVLFDADETLFHFDAFRGLQLVFKHYDVEFSAADFEHYQLTNKPLWQQFQLGQITANDLQTQRFSYWGKRLGVAPIELNQRFLQAMATITTLIDGVEPLLAYLRDKVKLGIVTNGFTALQGIRLAQLGLTDTFDIVVSSEQAGVAKPDPAIFHYALSQMGQVQPSQILMVGDNFIPDIHGGQNVGFDTCWFNPQRQTRPDNTEPATYTIENMATLQHILSL
ncbi:putative hydrolase of the HAD superfamily [Pseudoalteromonas ulvae UL12]|uniref:Noncanonical pyrimidine nucleotidase, YjjG family n=1 Tax=Pseudoalteromonas ulvae TaxID=107327 RepID=A0A244CVI8_PSEDV|nr:pyrimidine 5'-nucleotidase [Pseudoalteromonas ulvae]MBE0362342.1 putative hydrolase of the HAD superfamily [Pseudoalteromonas ulvae UL12]OUL59647.1 noncanonical pyrimidine nucleotidase, YjjG family [Pseudoalteromonas ulvae]